MQSTSNQSWNVGILVVGSLLWDQSAEREQWRRDRLKDLSEKKKIQAPIRYGRVSSSRGFCYTMVLDDDLKDEQLGQAYVIPAENGAKGNSIDDLIDALLKEAKELAKAEGIGSGNTCIAKWGAIVGALWRTDPRRRNGKKVIQDAVFHR